MLFEQVVNGMNIKLGIEGYSYDDLCNIPTWNEREDLLSKYYLKSPYLGIINIDEYDTVLKFKWEDNYVPQGSTYLDKEDKLMAITLTKEQTSQEKAEGKERESYIVIVDREKGEEISRTPIKGKPNDITAIIKDGLLIVPDHKDGLHGEWNIYKYSKDGTKVDLQYKIEDINSDALDYDNATDEMVIINGERGYVYDKDTILNKDLSSEERPVKRSLIVADEVHDYDNNEYYTTRGGISVENNIMTVCHGGFNVIDSDAYENVASEEVGNFYVQINTATGKIEGHYKDSIKQESEGVNYTKEGNTSVTMNYGSETRVYVAKNSQYTKDYIAQNYNKETTIKAKIGKKGNKIKTKNK